MGGWHRSYPNVFLIIGIVYIYKASRLESNITQWCNHIIYSVTYNIHIIKDWFPIHSLLEKLFNTMYKLYVF